MTVAAVLPAFRPMDWAEFRRNVLAGLVVGVIALPLSIALAVAVGVAPAAGLYTAVFAGGVAAVFGGSRFNITGPTAALVPVLSHAVIAHGAEALPVLAAMAGIILIGLRLLRAGQLMRYLPGTVLVGFTAGIAASLAFGQLNNFMGLSGTDPSLEHFHERTLDAFRHVGTMHWETPMVAACALASLLIWPRLRGVRMVPAPLVAVVAFTAITWGFGVDVATVESKYGAIPQSLPTPSSDLVDLGLMVELLPLALSVAVLAGVESLLCAVVADGMAGDRERHDSDRELGGQGLANIVAAVFGGVPATAAIARTGAAIRSGSTSRLTGVVHALFILVVTLLMGGLASHIPLAVLAAVLLTVAWRIAETREVWRLARKSAREDATILIATIAITLFLDLTYAIGFGILASMVLLVRQLSQVPAAQALLPDHTGRIRQVSPELSEMMQSRPDIVFFNAEGVVGFSSAAAFEYELSSDDGRPLILRMKDVSHIDATGLITLEGVIEHRHRAGATIMLTAVQPAVRARLERFGILDLVGSGNVFDSTREAIAALDGRRVGHE